MHQEALTLQTAWRWIRPFIELARIHRPVGIWLLFLPSLWGLIIAYQEIPHVNDIAVFALGAFLMRGIGCTLNDIIDRQFDAKVERTKDRPLVIGHITLSQAFGFLIIQMALGLWLLSTFNQQTILLGFVGLSLTLLYPWMKRFTHWPQVLLGFCMNWGMIMAHASFATKIQPTLFILYCASILWTLGYDTIYAHQDKADDMVLGLKSSAIALQGYTKPFLAFCYGTFMVALISIGVYESFSFFYFMGITGPFMHFWWQIKRFDPESRRACHRLFLSNQWLGLLVTCCLLTGYLLK
jgi:4-hydroxybenzoate polyprenyltransferase